MAAWVVCALCALIILKPNEFISALEGLPLVYILFGVAALLTILDVVRGRTRAALAPQIPFAIGFVLWALATTTLKRPDALDQYALPVIIVLGILIVVALGAASRRGLALLALTFLGCGLTVTAVAIIQAYSPLGCMLADPNDWQGKGELDYDGRPCETEADCRRFAPVPNGNYSCEHVGPWRTTSVGGRVRYRGSLADPNELTLMTAMALPFAFALVDYHDRKRPRPAPRRVRLPLLLSDRLLSLIASVLRAIPLSLVVGAIGFVTVLARSRGGLIVFLLVVGVQFIRRLGAWGVVAGCVLGPPMVLLGGRSGAEADESADERTELLRESFEFIRNTKGTGLGLGQFADESSLGMTAHNAYTLAAAEVGLVGLCLFALTLYASIKVPVAVWFSDEHRVSRGVRRFAPALATALVGAAVGIVFLSWSYKDVLYMMFGASAALYGAARADDPRFSVRVSATEAVCVCAAATTLLLSLYIAARFAK